MTNTSTATRRYRLYVTELGRFHSPDGRPTVYVGSTSLGRRQRFRQHRQGGFTASRKVTRYWTRRSPELSRGTGMYSTRNAAEQAERALRLGLEVRGYRVFRASGRPMPHRRAASAMDTTREMKKHQE